MTHIAHPFLKFNAVFTMGFLIGIFLIPTACCQTMSAPVAAAIETPTADPAIRQLIDGFSAREMRKTVEDLEGFTSRTISQPGNRQAAAYLFKRFAAINGLRVEYQDGDLRNVIATLPGTDPTAKEIYMAGAHYDSVAEQPDKAPGAMDDATGCAIVLEMARLASGLRFRHTLVFACWNDEERGMRGSRAHVKTLKANGAPIGLYLNYDSTGYDPQDRLVLDVIATPNAAGAKAQLILHNRLYDIGFKIVENQHNCGGDHVPFAQAGYPAINTHQEEHGAHYHTANDKIALVSFRYALKNGQLGLSLLSHFAQ